MTSVSELLGRFDEPGHEYGPLPIWWWSGAEVTSKRLRWQMEQLVSQGVHQAVVMCLAPTGPLYGSLADDPPFLGERWLAILDEVCADAEQLGFRLWMYDQLGFSGANFQGRLTAARPEYAGLALDRTTAHGDAVEVRVPEGRTALAAYAVPESGEPVAVPVVDGVTRWTGRAAELNLVHSGVSGFDYFGEQACAKLLDSVHGELERQVGRWFGRSIHGFFQDELPAMPTWGRRFASTFEDAYGYDLLPWSWALWHGEGKDAAAVRRDYQEHRARLARRAFFDPLDAWFARTGLLCGFDQPSPAREGDPVGGVQVYGDYLGTHSGYGAPGSDHWGDPKVHSSLAHAHGRPRTWIEAFHSSGWGGTLEETYDWLAPFLRRGATLYDPHAVYYSTVGGWWEWAPPSTCWRQPYWPSYHVFATAVARLCSLLTTGEHVCDVALLSPTTTAQGYLTLDGPLPQARRAAASYHELNGVSCWYAERRGALECAGVDHDVLDESTIASGAVVDGALRVGAETYRTVVVPEMTALHADAARMLQRLVDAGGRVVCVGEPPSVLLGGEATAALRGAIVVSDAATVHTVVAAGPVRVDADAPYLLRRHGDAHVLLLAAHDDRTGTQAPIVSLVEEDWPTEGFPWEEYWRQLRTDGYEFVPATGRVAAVSVRGVGKVGAQLWDPGTGERSELAVQAIADGLSFEVPFDGPVAVVVLAADLPAPTRTRPGAEVETISVDGPWRALATSTLDNRWGDVGPVDRTGVLPIQVWRMAHSVDGERWQEVVTSFGAFAEVRGPDDAEWRPAEWSLSRGIRDDPVHADTLGPKGYVPEEFLDWRQVPAGGVVAFRTHLPLPDQLDLALAVGANAVRTVRVAGQRLAVEGDGYLSFSPLPADARGQTVAVEVELRAEVEGPVRASFAVVTDRSAYLRPEWLVADGDVSYSVELTELPSDPTMQVASDGACSVLVNGVEIGRQGDFSPYPGHREVRVHPYDLTDRLVVGENTVTLRADGGTAVLLDSVPAEGGGLGWTTGPEWHASGGGVARLRRQHPRDPRFVCLRARPHPLPGASWLQPDAAGEAVVRVVPDVAPAGPRTEYLRFPAPLGAVAFRVPSGLPATLVVGGGEYLVPAGGEVRLSSPLPAASPVLLRVEASDGRRGGALLDGPVEVDVEEAETLLAPWPDLGLRALAGHVTYRTTVAVPDLVPGDRYVLDLGEVRGCADVIVNGVLTDRLVWAPWVSEVTDALQPGENEVKVTVRGTLAGYLDDASPTVAVAATQLRTGLEGPVVLRRCRG